MSPLPVVSLVGVDKAEVKVGDPITVTVKLDGRLPRTDNQQPPKTQEEVRGIQVFNTLWGTPGIANLIAFVFRESDNPEDENADPTKTIVFTVCSGNVNDACEGMRSGYIAIQVNPVFDREETGYTVGGPKCLIVNVGGATGGTCPSIIGGLPDPIDLPQPPPIEPDPPGRNPIPQTPRSRLRRPCPRRPQPRLPFRRLCRQ